MEQNNTIQKEKDYPAERKGRESKRLAVGTSYLLNVMFYGGIAVTVTLPVSLRLLEKYVPLFQQAIREHYIELLVIYAILGVAALFLIAQLRHIFRTVLQENCFVMENVKSLRKMGNISFFIAGMSLVQIVLYPTITMAVVVLVFLIAGLFSKVLALVFEEAVRYKEENDLTI